MRSAENGMLLLTCALGQNVKPLTATEYSVLMQRMAMGPGDGPDGQKDAAFFRGLGYPPEAASRLERLLDRQEVLEGYLAAEPQVRVVTRLSEGFPQQLRVLGKECPTALFCIGDVSLLCRPGVALVGSRRLNDHGRRFAEHLGRLAAKEGYVLISGGAEGADRAAQEACLAAGGAVICVVPDRLTDHISRENVLFCSMNGYDCPFSSWRALARNHVIHALGEAAFVAQCSAQKGGTWAGATDNLRRKLSDLYIWWEDCEGMRGLSDLGATVLRELPESIRSLAVNELSIFDGIF